MPPSPQDESAAFTLVRGLPQTSGGRILAHLLAALLSCIIVVIIGSKILNAHYFSKPALIFVCNNGSLQGSDVLKTNIEMDEACLNQ